MIKRLKAFRRAAVEERRITGRGVMRNLFRALRPLASDFRSTIVFVGFYAATARLDSAVRISVATGAGIAVGCLQIAYLHWRGRPIDAMNWASLGLVVVLGSATLLTHDPRFVMVKPTFIAFAIAVVMLRRNWMARYLPPIVIENVSPRVPLIWGYVWCAAFFALGAANLVVAFAFGVKTWAWFVAVVPISVKLALFLAQYAQLRHAVVVARSRRQSVENLAVVT
jgi:intracellular septation protein